MKKFYSLIPILFVFTFCIAQKVSTPDKIYGQLFHDVQMNKVFADGKTFVDCLPKRSPSAILADYNKHKKSDSFNLKRFVSENFQVPVNPADSYQTDTTDDVSAHIKKLWKVLRRDPDKVVEGSSLLALPYPYIVPGGRFREIYYWDSYFTMLGLKESGEIEMIENMVKNFAFLINTYGHIPNGNRTYYLGRSQPPFFAAMVNLLAEVKGDSIYKQFLQALEKEYRFWMEGSAKLVPGQAYRRVVKLKDGTILNRYWDDSTSPRQESYKEDIETAEEAVRHFITVALFRDAAHQKKATDDLRRKMYRHLRAGAESGIDFSSRWFDDGQNLSTIHTTDFIPPDLNALLYNLEMTIAKAKMKQRDEIFSNEFRKKANNRLKAIQKYCYNSSIGYYTDYDFVKMQKSNSVTPGGMYPFFFFESGHDVTMINRMAAVVRARLLKDGGIVTSEKNTGQQWDAPNGWPPLVWMTVGGLEKTGQKDLAKEIGHRWISLNVKVYRQTGKLMEKYDVEDTRKLAGGGEYPSQDGFGWTNGVLLRLISMYGMPSANAGKSVNGSRLTVNSR